MPLAADDSKPPPESYGPSVGEGPTSEGANGWKRMSIAVTMICSSASSLLKTHTARIFSAFLSGDSAAIPPQATIAVLSSAIDLK